MRIASKFFPVNEPLSLPPNLNCPSLIWGTLGEHLVNDNKKLGWCWLWHVPKEFPRTLKDQGCTLWTDKSPQAVLRDREFNMLELEENFKTIQFDLLIYQRRQLRACLIKWSNRYIYDTLMSKYTQWKPSSLEKDRVKDHEEWEKTQGRHQDLSLPWAVWAEVGW